jgi:pantoate--beta-alanine ligase
LEIIHTIEWMKQTARQCRAERREPLLVPTMGALHAGHLSLVRAARADGGPVVVSIFVNPKQFGPREDLETYPRDPAHDRALLEREGVEYMFAPPAEEMYPAGFATYAEVEGLSTRLEGRARPGHFRGVATVVLKLLEIVRPARAYFGRKDAQQARVVQQMARDLNLDSEIIVSPIVREPDGLALSSRNAYLSREERRAATVLFRSLEDARQRIAEGERDAARILSGVRETIAREPLATLDYAELASAGTFEPILFVRGAVYLLLAVRIGTTRLIDNLYLEENGGSVTYTL